MHVAAQDIIGGRLPHLLDPDALRWPADAIRALHEGPDVVYDQRLDAWLVIGHAECEEALRHPGLSARAVPVFMAQLEPTDRVTLATLEDHLNAWLVFSDGTRHEELRALVRRDFRPSNVKARAEEAADLIELVFNQLEVGQDFDLLADLATPIAVRFAALTLNLPTDLGVALAREAAFLMDFIAGPSPDLTRGLRALAALRTIENELAGAPDDTLYASYMQAGLGQSASLALMLQILTGILDPLASTIGSAAILLNGSAGVVRDDIHTFVEEVFRLDSAFRLAPRRSISDVAVGDHVIPKGQRVLILLQAANLDHTAFPNPHQMDSSRRKHLTFGAGSHYCLGAGDARQIVRLCVEAFNRRSLQITGPPQRRASFGSVAWTSIPAVFRS